MRNSSLTVLMALSLGACGDNMQAPVDAVTVVPDAAPDGAGPFAEAPHGDPPQTVSVGGPVMFAPKIVPIFFQGDQTAQSQLEQFLAELAASQYWPSTTSEYGVGPMTVRPTIVSADAPPTTDAALQTWLVAQTDGTHAGWPVPDGNTLFTVFLPSGVVLSTPFGNSCQAFGGYHDEAMGSSSKIIYALLPRCSSTNLDSVTTATSHELVEATTDPFPSTDGAFQNVDPDHLVWGLTPGGELGDMCEYVGLADQRLVGTFAVQRTWSNAAARAGHDPCVPALTTPYVGAAPQLDELVTVDLGNQGGVLATKGVQLSLGMSKTIEVALFSDAPADDWTVKATDAAALMGGGAELSFAWDKTTGHNGDKLHLTITRLKAGQGGSEFVVSSRINNVSASLWWGFVAN